MLNIWFQRIFFFIPNRIKSHLFSICFCGIRHTHTHTQIKSQINSHTSFVRLIDSSHMEMSKIVPLPYTNHNRRKCRDAFHHQFGKKNIFVLYLAFCISYVFSSSLWKKKYFFLRIHSFASFCLKMNFFLAYNFYANLALLLLHSLNSRGRMSERRIHRCRYLFKSQCGSYQPVSFSFTRSPLFAHLFHFVCVWEISQFK